MFYPTNVLHFDIFLPVDDPVGARHVAIIKANSIFIIEKNCVDCTVLGF